MPGVCAAAFGCGVILLKPSYCMFRPLLIIPFFFSLAAGSSAARFTLESAVTYAMAHNPDLAAARFSTGEARGRLLGSGRLSNPELEAELRPNVKGREFSFSVGYVQRFPLTNRLQLEQSVSASELAAAEAEFRTAQAKLAAAVRSVAVKILCLDNGRTLREKQIATSKELAAAATKIAATAEGSGLEATQFELEAQQLSLNLLTLESERATLTGEARPLLGVSGSEPVEFDGGLPLAALPGNTRPDVSARPDYQAALARADAARQGIDVARANKWADAGVGLGAELERAEDAPDGLQTDGMIGLKFSFPLPLWNKNEGKILEAASSSLRAQKEAEAITAHVRAEVAAALGEMKAARRILDETTNVLLPKARSLEGKLAGFYKQSQPGVFLTDVLRSREKRFSIELANLDALRAFHLARIRYLAAMGR